MVAEGDERRPRYRAFGPKQIGRIPQLKSLSREQATALSIASLVFPFRVNEYVLEELIDWSAVPSDPMYQLTFPQAEMLDPRDFAHLSSLVKARAGTDAINDCARSIQLRMNPHPSGQMDLNVPKIDGRRLVGCQHKYRETVLYFPSGGQSCHAYCTYCFRWPQFVGIERLRFATRKIELLVSYLRAHHEVTNVLVTGGDPLVMSSNVLRRTIEPLLGEGLEHITSIRIGTKALSYWPYRFTSDPDADDLLRLFEDVGRGGRQLALMAHFSHPREISTDACRLAVQRVRSAGAVVRCQSPVIRHINDSPEVWAELWREQVRLGAVPYYMFVARDTGPRSYFELPLVDCLRIYSEAITRVSGLGRTVRGPVMSTTPGKVLVIGEAVARGERVFVLTMIQARDPTWVNRVFFARYDPRASWFDELEPAFDQPAFFFEPSPRWLASKRALQVPDHHPPRGPLPAAGFVRLLGARAGERWSGPTLSLRDTKGVES